MSNIAERLERLPFGRFHYRLLLMGGLGYMFEAVDAGMIAFLLPTLRPLWNLTSVETGLLASSTYFGFLIGALMAGWLGDRYGRRTVMSSALVFFCVASLASAFVSDWHSFFALRAIGGIGMGAEAAIIAPFLSEFVPSARRGAFTASLATFFCFGFTSAALIGFFVVPAATDGWRYALVLTALPVVLVLWWRRSLYESPRWLASQGRHQEADAVVEQIEREFVARGVALPPPQPGRPVKVMAPASFLRNFASLWSPALRRVTTMTWMLWLSVTFCNYAYLAWLPTLFIDRGMTVTRSFSYVILIYLAQAPGYFLAAYLCERIGRPNTIVTYMLFAAASAGLLAFAETDAQVLGLSMLLSAFSNGIAAGQYAYTPEVFPTEVRATGVGSASAFGRIGGISAPIIVGAIYPSFGFSGVFAMTTAVLLTGAAAVLLLGIPTKNRSLEDISAETVPQPLA